MSNKRRSSFVFVVALVLCLLTTATCAPKEVEKEVTRVVEVEKVITATPEPKGFQVTPPGTLPIVEDRVTLTILAAGDKDYNINSFTKWVEEQTNVDIEYDMASGPQARDKLNLAVNAGDLPDVIMAFDLTLADQQVLAEQGIIIPLDDLIEQYGFETKIILDRFPEIRDNLALPDGQFYSLWIYAGVLHVSISQKLWIYEPWLKALDLEMPTTTQEFYEVLKAFKTQDPNGNGQADEIPLSGSPAIWQGLLHMHLMNSFVFNDRLTSKSLMVEDGTIKASYVQPGWQEGLKYLRMLYDEGLIDPQIFTQDRTQLTALGEAETPILGACTAGWYGQFTRYGDAGGRYMEYAAVPPLEGPTGLRQTPHNIYQPAGTGVWLITKDCEHPEVAFRMADYWYSHEATMRNVWGEKGLDWREGEPGEVAINGGPAVFNMLRPWSTDPNTFMNVGPQFQPPEQRYGQIMKEGDVETVLYRISQNDYVPYAVSDKILPSLAFTAEQSTELGELDTVVNTYVDQAFAEFVTGGLDPEKDWETYLGRLDDLGLQRYLEIYQEAYDTKMGK